MTDSDDSLQDALSMFNRLADKPQTRQLYADLLNAGTDHDNLDRVTQDIAIHIWRTTYMLLMLALLTRTNRDQCTIAAPIPLDLDMPDEQIAQLCGNIADLQTLIFAAAEELLDSTNIGDMPTAQHAWLISLMMLNEPKQST